MSLDYSKTITIYSDGSCNYTDRTGGWAWVAVDSKRQTELASGFVSDTTSNRMELYAPAVALLQLYLWYGPCKIIVRSDSRYVVLGITNPQRARNKNTDLWEELENAIKLHDKVKWKHVKGHNGNRHNVLADRMAGEARKNGYDNEIRSSS